jgi:hypothetical protein
MGGMTDQAQPTPPEDGADAELDAATLAHDVVRQQYVIAQRAFRRRVAIYLLVVFLVGGSAMIAFALTSDAAAKRVAEISNVIGTFMLSIAGLLAAYFGAGSMDNRSMLGGGMYGGFGGIGGMGGYGGMSSIMRRPISTGVSSRAD